MLDHGSRGLIAAGNPHADSVEVAGADGYRRAPLMHFFLERYEAAYRSELDAFIGAVERGERPSPDGGDGVAALALADAAQRSLDEGRVVAL